MSRSERLLALMQSLRPRRHPVTAATLAAEFAVSERTIYRDLAALVRRGAAIEGAAGIGYILRKGHFLPPLMLDPVEANAIALGLRFVMRRGDPELANAARSALSKISAVLPEPSARASEACGLVSAPADGPLLRTLGQLRTAMARERKVAMTYRDGQGAESRRVVWPVAIGFFDEGEMLAAWCEDRQGFRHFRLDRILDLEPLDDRLPTPHRILLARYAATETGVVP